MNIKFNKEIIKNVILIGSPIAACAIGVGVYIAIKNKSNQQTIVVAEKNDGNRMTRSRDSSDQPQETLTNIGNVEVFPKLTTYDFYDQIRIKDGKQIITDEFIAAVVNKVIKEMIVTDGDILWTYNIDEERQHLSVTFHWDKQGDNRFWKTYNFSLSASV